jgi:hypothetical protein
MAAKPQITSAPNTPDETVPGPVRCRKSGPARPFPEGPPVVRDLPPTDRQAYHDPPELLEIRRRFNAGDYRGCVEPIEVLFFARRNTFHQGLLQYTVALHQLGLGLVRTPCRLLRQALALWEPYPGWQEGIDLAALRSHAGLLLAHLPEDVDRCEPEAVRNWWVAPPRLEGDG